MPLVIDGLCQEPTYKIIGLAMEVHNELGPGHREADYHDALLLKLKRTDLDFEDEPEVLITLDSGEVVKIRKPDFVVAQSVIVELKGRQHQMTKDDQAQVIGYFAALPACKIALFFNFGRPRLEYHRLFPPKKVTAFQRQKWGKPIE
ncbi:MAG TPA: GxxExxY protein [Anaerolineae bacterium]|nr:GxxExxY protein [Anaerolineae bacterium]